MSASNHDHTDIDRLHAAVNREKQELPPGHEPAPMWVIMLGFAVAIFAAGSAAPFANGFSFDTSNAYANLPIVDPRPQTGDEAVLGPFEQAMKSGSKVYATCGGCHQPTGVGIPGQFPPLAGSEFALGGTERLVRIVLSGLTGPITVKGTGYNTPNGMPAQGAAMSDADIANVITFVRNSFGNTGSMVTKDMVSAVRAKEKAHVAQWTNAELDAYAEKNCPGDVPGGPGAAAAGAPPAKK
jgi:mono/diheme cytochrome c family protein